MQKKEEISVYASKAQAITGLCLFVLVLNQGDLKRNKNKK